MATNLTIYQRAHVFLLDNPNDELLTTAAKNGGNGVDYALKFMFLPPPHGMGFSAIKVKVLDGKTSLNTGYAKFLKDRRKALGLKFLVGGWSQNRDDARGEARKASEIITEEILDFWEPCCEFEYKGDPGTAEWNRSKEYTETFRNLRPKTVVGFVGMPNEPAGLSYDWLSWRNATARWIPECNPGYHPTAPTQWPHEAQRVGNNQFFKSYIHPSLGFQNVSGTPKPRAVDFSASLRAAKLEGFTWGYSVYSAHYLDNDDWLELSRYNKVAGTREALAWYPV